MENIKVKVHPGSWAAGHISQHFKIRDNHSLIYLSGIIGYVLDDCNRIRQVPLEHIEVVSFEGDKGVTSLQEYYKRNPKKRLNDGLPTQTQDFPKSTDGAPYLGKTGSPNPTEQKNLIDKVKPLSEEDRIAAGDGKLKEQMLKDGRIKEEEKELAGVTDGTPD